jgi:hypothetical protein
MHPAAGTVIGCYQQGLSLVSGTVLCSVQQSKRQFLLSLVAGTFVGIRDCALLCCTEQTKGSAVVGSRDIRW